MRQKPTEDFKIISKTTVIDLQIFRCGKAEEQREKVLGGL